jgi:hypothetical protein
VVATRLKWRHYTRGDLSGDGILTASCGVNVVMKTSGEFSFQLDLCLENDNRNPGSKNIFFPDNPRINQIR